MSLSRWSLFILLTCALLTGCSSKNKEKSAADSEASAEEQTLDMLDDFEGEDLFAMDDQGLDDDLMENDDELVFSDNESSQSSEPMASSSPQIQQSTNYTVQEGDTLMYIAYKKYGDYTKWRSLARMNGLSGGQARLERGSTLELDSSMIRELPEPTGRPYVIKRGDTLSRISQQEYGTFNRWKELWQHNSVMIKDPDLIFAGFQMHLLPDGTVAANF